MYIKLNVSLVFKLEIYESSWWRPPMTEREGAEGSQLSQTLDFVPLRQRVLSEGHCFERKLQIVLIFFLGHELSYF